MKEFDSLLTALNRLVIIVLLALILREIKRLDFNVSIKSDCDLEFNELIGE